MANQQPNQQQPKRVTELSNPFTVELDSVSEVEFVRKIRQADGQLFAGWDTYPNVYELSETLAAVSRAAEGPLRRTIEGKEKNVFVFSGCGTSGRVAWLCARGLNAMIKSFNPDAPACFHYLLSGGDEALIVSKELPEDDPHLGAKELRQIIQDCDNSFFFGITCGLSAPYVGGQIELAMETASCTPVLVGFNPIGLARDADVEGWSTTCKQVFTRLESQANTGEGAAFILNPIVGPEAVTGSSRMKGGSMTKILLEAVFLPILAPLCGFSDMIDAPAEAAINSSIITKVVSLYEQAYRDTYRNIEGIAGVIKAVGSCLSHADGHLYYLGTGISGMVGIMDASEMVDTYGSRLDEVRAFVDDGWRRCCNNEGDMSNTGPLFRISFEEFKSDCCPNLSEHDVIVLVDIPNQSPILDDVLKSSAQVCVLNVLPCGSSLDHRFNPIVGPGERVEHVANISLTVPEPGSTFAVFTEFALKLAMNLISTGANTIKGRVYGNSMINLTVSNNKLFHRSAEIVSDLTGASISDAEECLIRAIHGLDALSEKDKKHPTSYHIEIATPQANIVPTAALLATKKYSFAETQSLLSSTSSLRSLIADASG